jgi:hypothetical protein
MRITVGTVVALKENALANRRSHGMGHARIVMKHSPTSSKFSPRRSDIPAADLDPNCIVSAVFNYRHNRAEKHINLC